MEPELTQRQEALRSHIVDALDEIGGSRTAQAATLPLDAPVAQALKLDSLDLVEFLLEIETRWPPLAVVEDAETERALFDGTLHDVVLWLERLLVEAYSPDWMPEIVQ